MAVESLAEQIQQDGKRQAVIDDALQVLDAEVADKGGLSGVAVKGAYKIVKGIKPGFLNQVVDHLLDEFLVALNPLYQEAFEQGKGPKTHIESNQGRMAEALLAVTDARAKNAQRAVIQKTYQKLRPTAQKHVEAAAPRLGAMIERHAKCP